MKKKLQEHFVHKDGVWLQPFSHLRADAVKIEVWQNDKKIESQEYVYGYYKPQNGETIVEGALALAHEWSKKYNLPIIDGSGVEYYTFPSEYRRTDHRTYDSWKPIVNDPDVEVYEYSDQDLDDMDERPRQTVKWAICKEPNLFDIYDNVTKNPGRLWDTEMFRGMTGYDGRRERELMDFFEKHAENVYEGTWDDIKDGKYTILVNGRIYESRYIAEKFNAIVKAGFSIDGERINGNVTLGTIKDNWGDEVEDNFSFDKTIDKYGLGSGDKEAFLKKATLVYDALTCAGIFFPEEFKISANSEEFDEYKRRKTYEYTVRVEDGKLTIGTTDKLRNFEKLQVGDIIGISSSSSGSRDNVKYYVVLEINGKKAKVARCSKSVKTDDSIWGNNYSQLISPKMYQDALKGKFTTRYQSTEYGGDEVDDTYIISLLDNSFFIVATKDEVMKQLKWNMHQIRDARNGYLGTKKGDYRSDLPDNSDEFFGEPTEDAMLTDWEKKDKVAATNLITAGKDVCTAILEDAGFTKVEENDNKDMDDRDASYKVVYKNDPRELRFRFSHRSPEYTIRIVDKDGYTYKGSYSGRDAEELEKDLKEILERFM